MKKQCFIDYTPTFAKNYKKLPTVIKNKAEKRELIFRQDPFSSSLKTHKLTGKLSDYWSFSIDYHHRIVFRFTDPLQVLFVDVATHSIYR